MGSDQGLVFVETRAKADAIREREGYPAGSSHRAVPQYALTATFYDLPSGRTNYHLLTFQMVDFRGGLLIWEGYHEVKL